MNLRGPDISNHTSVSGLLHRPNSEAFLYVLRTNFYAFVSDKIPAGEDAFRIGFCAIKPAENPVLSERRHVSLSSRPVTWRPSIWCGIHIKCNC